MTKKRIEDFPTVTPPQGDSLDDADERETPPEFEPDEGPGDKPQRESDPIY